MIWWLLLNGKKSDLWWNFYFIFFFLLLSRLKFPARVWMLLTHLIPFFSLCVCRTSGVSMHEKEIYPVAGKIELFSWEFFSLLKLICEENFASTVETTANERERWNLRMMLEGITRQSQNHHQSSPTTSAGIHHFHETEFDSVSVVQFFLFSASHLKSNFTGRRNKQVEC